MSIGAAPGSLYHVLAVKIITVSVIGTGQMQMRNSNTCQTNPHIVFNYIAMSIEYFGSPDTIRVGWSSTLDTYVCRAGRAAKEGEGAG